MTQDQPTPVRTQNIKKICFVAPYTYSLFNQQTKFPFGGAEVRACFIGEGIAAADQSLQVSFVTFNHMQEKSEEYGNVEVWRDNIIPPSRQFIRTVNWWTSRGISRRVLHLLQRIFCKPEVIIRPEYKIYSHQFDVYREIDADIYCVFGVHDLAAKVGAFCKENSKKFTIFTASDEDFSTMYYRLSIEVNPYGNIGYIADYAIRIADTIICQTEYQAKLCHERYDRNAFIVRSPARDLKNKPELEMGTRGGYILWVGKSDYNKNPEAVLSLARKLPDVQFVMVMSKSSPSLHRKIILNQMPNVEIIDYLPYREMEKLFENALVFLNTSKFEGFPNTFLQAGCNGVPIASLTVDPDNFIVKHKCGISASGDIQKLELSIRHLLKTPELWKQYAGNLYDYVCRFHDPEVIINEVKNILSSRELNSEVKC